jgi:putative transposase
MARGVLRTPGEMTVARQVLPGRITMVSRRCTQRQLLLRPDERVEQLFLYCLGEAAERYGVTLHGWIAMSNHEHLIVQDNHGNLPEFIGHLHRMLAKAMNARLGRWENFWASEQTSLVWLVAPDDAFDKLVYLLANPVAADLVEHVRDWPGACSFEQHLSGMAKTVRRPRGFFREDGPMPEQVTLCAERLDGFESLSDADWSARIAGAVRDAEEAARRARAGKGQRVLGRKAVLRALPTDTPKTVAARRGLRPCVACRDPARRQRVLVALVAFREKRKAALIRHLAGERGVLFPCGTYRVRGIFVCAPPPTDLALAS